MSIRSDGGVNARRRRIVAGLGAASTVGAFGFVGTLAHASPASANGNFSNASEHHWRYYDGDSHQRTTARPDPVLA
jgi:hypothetical protein